MISSPWHVSILIPARNEEKLLPRCLQSVFISLSMLPPCVTTDVIVAVDRSTDLTYQIAKDMTRGRGLAISIDSGVVGKARAEAAETAMRRYKGPWNRLWLANTDADCVVPDTWVIEQLLLAGKSVEAVAGTVEVDSFEEHGRKEGCGTISRQLRNCLRWLAFAHPRRKSRRSWRRLSKRRRVARTCNC